MTNNEIKIHISDGYSNIGNISQGDFNTIQAASDLSELLNKLKKDIKNDQYLSEEQRQIALINLDNFTREQNKENTDQTVKNKNIFWKNLTDTIKLSTALAGLASAISKLL